MFFPERRFFPFYLREEAVWNAAMRRCVFPVLALFFFCHAAAAVQTTLLSDLDLSGVRQAHGQPQSGANVMGGPLTVAGKEYERGIGTHAVSSWKLQLAGKGRRLSGLAGLTDSPGNETGSCEFIIRGDGRELWNSGKMLEGDAARPFAVDLSGVGELELAVTDGGDNNWSDHAAWLEPRLEHDGAPLPVSPVPAELVLEQAPGQLSGEVPDSGLDVGPALRRLLAAARPGTVVRLEPGRYDIWRQRAVKRPWQHSNSDPQASRRYGVLLENARGVTLDGGGADLLFHGTQTGIGLAFCEEITLRNFTMDWGRPELSQGTVLETGDDFVTVEMHPDSPAEVAGGRLVFPCEGEVQHGTSTMEFDARTAAPAYRRGDLPAVGAAEELRPGVFRCRTQARYSKGNTVIFRHGARTHSVLLIHRCRNTVLEKVDAYSSCGLGFLAQHSDGARFADVRYIPKPGSGRVFSSRDDGLQVSGCRGLIEVDRCVFEGMMDDPINVHGTYLPVSGRSNSRTLRCRFGHGQSVGQNWWAEPGDVVQYVARESLQARGRNTVESFRLLNDHESEVRFWEPVPEEIGPGWVLENMDAHPAVRIANSRFGKQRARGVLVTTPRPVRIENNEFQTSGSAILINGDANGWYESGVVRDVLIRGNTFIDCNQASYQFCEGVISIDPVLHRPQEGKYTHGNIRIENNLFKTFDAPVLFAKSVEGLVFSGNIIERTDEYPAWHPRRSAVTLERCRGVVIGGTRLVGEVLGPEVRADGATEWRQEPGDALKAVK